MSVSFSPAFPSWLVQPSVLTNIISNQFLPLKDVSTAVTVPDITIFNSGFKQALYWRRQLSSSASTKTAFFSFLGVRGLTLPNALEVCQALKSICDMTKLVEVYRAPNSPFIGISFSDSSQTSIFQSLCVSFQNFLVIHVSPSNSLTHHFKLLWLPPLFSDDRIHHFLAKHSAQHHFTRELIETDTNIFTPSNSVSGIIQLSPQQDINAIPHLIPLPAPHLGSALFIISGHSSLCLKCGSTGHIRRHCPSPKCHSCHRFHLVTSSCTSSEVSSVASVINPWIQDDFLLSSQLPLSSISADLSSESNDTHALSSPLKSPSPVASSLPTPIVMTAISSNGTTPSSSTLPLCPSLLETALISDSAYTVIKRHSKSSTAKRSRLASNSSSSSSHNHDLQSKNIFASLIDEALYNIDDSSCNKSEQSSDKSTLSAPTATASFDVTLEVADVNLFPAAGSTASSLLVHKRAKISTSETNTALPSSLQASYPFTFAPTTSWGERMEVETVEPAVTVSPPLNVSLPCSTSSASFPTSTSIIDTHVVTTASSVISSATITQPSLSTFSESTSSITLPTPSASQDSNSDCSESSDNDDSDPDFINVSWASDDPALLTCVSIKLTGFPDTATYNDILAFIGQPLPHNIHLFSDDEGNSKGCHLLKYSSLEQAQPILAKDGAWHLSHIMSVSLLDPDPDSD